MTLTPVTAFSVPRRGSSILTKRSWHEANTPGSPACVTGGEVGSPLREAVSSLCGIKSPDFRVPEYLGAPALLNKAAQLDQVARRLFADQPKPPVNVSCARTEVVESVEATHASMPPAPCLETIEDSCKNLETTLTTVLAPGVYCLDKKWVLKAYDEVRGGRMRAADDGRGRASAKLGICHSLEIPNEWIVSQLARAMLGLDFKTLDSKFVRAIGLHNKKGICIPFIAEARGASAADSPSEGTLAFQDFQQIAAIDLRFGNVDRNFANLLVDKAGRFYPIDHALVAAESFASAGDFCWLEWEAAHKPFSPEVVDAINRLDFTQDERTILRWYPKYPLVNLNAMRITHHVLKLGVSKGLTPFQIAIFYAPQILKGGGQIDCMNFLAEYTPSGRSMEEVLGTFGNKMDKLKTSWDSLLCESKKSGSLKDVGGSFKKSLLKNAQELLRKSL